MAADLRNQVQLDARVWPKADVCREIRLPDFVLVFGAVSLVIVVLGLLAAPAGHKWALQAKAAAAARNAATLQLAAESYAAAHQGRYARDVLDLLPYLPDDKAPRNPYNGTPITFAGAPGDLTYGSPTRGGDYVIQAWAMGPGGRSRLVGTLTGRRDSRFCRHEGEGI